MSCQIILICGNEERRQFQEQQLKARKIPFPVVYLDASTPSNSKDYLAGYPPGEERDICCSRSHFRAVEKASSSPTEFTVILEDDAILHADFVAVVQELVEHWETLVPSRCGYVSLGWLPVRSYEAYTAEARVELRSSPHTTGFVSGIIGLQAYMIRKDVAKKFTPILIHPTYIEMRDLVRSKSFPNLGPNESLVAADFLFPRIMIPYVLHPPLAIEHPFPSMIGHKNQELYWNKYFVGHEDLRKLYYTPAPRIQIIIVCCSEERKAYQKAQMEALKLPYPYAFFDGFTPATSKDYIVNYQEGTPEQDTTICCLRSHIGAADFFLKTFPEADYAVIMEDDVALLRTFASELEQIITLWTSHKSEIDYVSLGYIPGEQKGAHGSSSSDGPLRWNPTAGVWGCQAYLLDRRVASDMVGLLHQPTTRAVRDAVTERLASMPGGEGYRNRAVRVQSDHLRGMLWRQGFVYPMMAVEASMSSLIVPGQFNDCANWWDKVFREGRRREDFYSRTKGIQIVVVTCSPTRKAFMKEQLDALGLPYPYAFFDGYTPETSKDFMVDRLPELPERDTTLCCFRSHVGALDYFLRTFPDKTYVLVLEDDVTLLRTFSKELETVMDLWNVHNDEIDYVSLGYNPGRHTGPHGSRFSDGVLRWGLDCPNGDVWGCMAYIMNRYVAADMVSVLHQPTTRDVRASVAKRVATIHGGKGYSFRYNRVQSDNLRGMLWRQGFVYPMMAIEAPLESIISPGVANERDGLWDKVFRDGRRQEDFYMIEEADPFAGVAKISLEPFCVRT